MLGKWITWWGLLTGFGWGITVALNPTSMSATPLNTVSKLLDGDQFLVSVTLFCTAFLALVAMLSDKITIPNRLMLFPQIFLMLVACGGSVQAVALGQYADGVQRPWPFILADQLPWIVAALTYTGAIVEHFFSRGNKWNTGYRSLRQ